MVHGFYRLGATSNQKVADLTPFFPSSAAKNWGSDLGEGKNFVFFMRHFPCREGVIFSCEHGKL
jgi:hypothetical protein